MKNQLDPDAYIPDIKVRQNLGVKTHSAGENFLLPAQKFYQAVGNNLRLSILKVIYQDAYTVSELCHIFDTLQPTMSHNLKILVEALLVEPCPEGNASFYRRCANSPKDNLAQLYQSLFDYLDSTPMKDVLVQKVADVKKIREAAAQNFFRENVGNFRETRDLVSTCECYESMVAELLQHRLNLKQEKALELGPGDGHFLPYLASQFEHITAVDTSVFLLERAKATQTKYSLDNVSFIHGDVETALAKGIQVDCIFVNMVFHHLPSPLNALRHLSALLKTGGSLFITDLCSHNQNWVRNTCGHLWLGFDPEQLKQWVVDVGFIEETQGLYLAQKNGFRVQARHFTKPDPLPS